MLTAMLNRRELLATLVSGALMGAETKPNIVMIYADDLGYGDLGCYGNPTIRTPHLDKMAAEGMRWTQFYSTSPLCSPSRAALMTGRYPVRCGISKVLFPYSTGGLKAGETTVADALKGVGYATAIVGKWHLGHKGEYLPTRHGFDSYFGIPYSNDMSPATSRSPRKSEYPPTPLMRNETVAEQEPDQSTLTGRYTEEATGFIRASARAKKPFFLYFAHTFPHWPLAASAKFKGKSKRGLFGDAVEELDWSVGEVLRAVKEAGVEGNTLVMFSSDNGPAMPLREEGGTAGQLSGWKSQNWEGGQREPFIARWPGRIKAGQVSHAFGCTMDILPTCAKLAGARAPVGRELDGADLGPALFQGDESREALFFYYGDVTVRAVRKGPWKLWVTDPKAGFAQKPARTATPLLFHLEHDPSERFNVAEKQPEVVRELTALVDRHVAQVKIGELQE
ncbi:MAG: sulfatase [Acidobacteria bacterium]|nr:sulfatase [Acidobacteriota bacterium]